jgi:hypothetical protein
VVWLALVRLGKPTLLHCCAQSLWGQDTGELYIASSKHDELVFIVWSCISIVHGISFAHGIQQLHQLDSDQQQQQQQQHIG